MSLLGSIGGLGGLDDSEDECSSEDEESEEREAREEEQRLKLLAACLLMRKKEREKQRQGPKVCLPSMSLSSFLYEYTTNIIILWQGPKRTDNSPFSWEDHVARLSVVEFTARYRVNPQASTDMVVEFRPFLETVNNKLAKNSKGATIVIKHVFNNPPPLMLIPREGGVFVCAEVLFPRRS
jgi:hypothetical protein